MANLSFYEWLIISLLILILFAMAFITFWKTEKLPRIAAKHDITNEVVQASIEGAVARPGAYEFKKGAKIKDLLAAAKPLPEADLSRIRPNAKLRDGQKVLIQAEKWITVRFEGAIRAPVDLVFKEGAFLKDILDKLDFLPEADISKLQKKRRLKDKEVIVVPVKKMKKSQAVKNAPENAL